MKIDEFLRGLSSDAPTPGGGAAAAVAGACGAALMLMVSNLTLKNGKYVKSHSEMRRIASIAQPGREEFLRLADLDACAFNSLLCAMQQKPSNDAEKAARKSAINTASVEATLVPLHTLELAVSLSRELPVLARLGIRHAVSDVGVAGCLLDTAFSGAELNVMINLPGIVDEQVRQDFTDKIKLLKPVLTDNLRDSRSEIKL